MKLHEACLPCIVGQAVKTAKLTNAENREELYHSIFHFLSEADFEMTAPEIIGSTFELLKKHTGCSDPYLQTRSYYNNLFLNLSEKIEKIVCASAAPFKNTVRAAIIGNIIDFNPVHSITEKEILSEFRHIDRRPLALDCIADFLKDIKEKRELLYLGDNCGEICLDKLLIKKMRELNPNLHVVFAVKGKPVVNDSVLNDAFEVGLNEYADIISNGDGSLGTVLHRTSQQFQKIYGAADIVVAKGQANYECLSEEHGRNIYFLLMTKCREIADDIGVPEMSLVCKKSD